MSDNPVVESVLNNMEAMWDEAFRMARRIINRHAPDDSDSDERIRNEYASFVPAIASSIYHDLVNMAGFIGGAPQKDINAHVETMSNFIHELRSRSKLNKAGK